MLVVNVVSLFSIYSILGYLKVFKLLIFLEVRGLSLSLNMLLGVIKIGSVMAFGLYFSFPLL